jgi:hypothetical protein
VPPTKLLPLLVGDASSDIAGHPRSAFPKNTVAFRTTFGDAFTKKLIAHRPTMHVRCGGFRPRRPFIRDTGSIQYDLQHVQTDEAFFRDFLLHTMGPCLARLTRELDGPLRGRTAMLAKEFAASMAAGRAPRHMPTMSWHSPSSPSRSCDGADRPVSGVLPREREPKLRGGRRLSQVNCR